MFNPIEYIKEIIDAVKRPVGEVKRAVQITPEIWEAYEDEFAAWQSTQRKKFQIGDYLATFAKRPDIITVIPKEEFEKQYALLVSHPLWADEEGFYPVVRINPL